MPCYSDCSPQMKLLGTSPKNLLEIQNFKPFPRPLDQNLLFNKVPRRSVCTVKCDVRSKSFHIQPTKYELYLNKAVIKTTK